MVSWSKCHKVCVSLSITFPLFQFVVVSLKDGMFNNANVLFRTKFVDGMSTVTRTVQHHNREEDADTRRGEKFHKPGMRGAADVHIGDDSMEEDQLVNGFASNGIDNRKKRTAHERMVNANGQRNGISNGAVESDSSSDLESSANGVNGRANNFPRQKKKGKQT